MVVYKVISTSNLSNNIIDELYINLLKNKWQFLIINVNGTKYVLTKEKSIFKINNIDDFLQAVNNDIYYKTNIERVTKHLSKKDLEIYKDYIDRYKSIMQKETYGEKYIFGSVAVKIENGGFITTIRGKQDLNDYTVVEFIDHENHVINVSNKKATLNAPLLDVLFKNKNVKAIVHVNHEYDEELPYYDYAFPGTVRDTMRDSNTSFNIKYHGVFYLFDNKGNLIKSKERI